MVLSQTRLVFAKLTSRMSVASAYAAAMRLCGYPYSPSPVPSAAFYAPDDPSFALDVSLVGVPIGLPSLP